MKLRRPVVCVIVLLAGILSIVMAFAEEPKTFELTGKVLLPDGSPAPGASVQVRYPEVGVTATCDDSGVYKMNLSPGEYWLKARLGDHTRVADEPARVRSDVSANKAPDIQLKRGCIVTGRLIDVTTGEPVSGAVVMTRRHEHEEATTDSDGFFRLPSLSKGRHTLTAVKDGYYRPVIHFSTSNRGSVDLVIETKPEGIVRGKVTDQEGSPIAGARVGASLSYFDFQAPKTDKNGEYILRGLDPDTRSEIGVSADGYNYVSDRVVVFPARRRELTLDFKLLRQGTRSIWGRVLKPDGTPAQGVSVSYGWTSFYGGYRSTKTDEDGRYRLDNVDATKNLVVVQGDGFAPGFKYVEADVDAEIDFKLEPGHSLEGRLVDEEGNPVAGAHISVSAESKEMDRMGSCGRNAYRCLKPEVTADEDGRFTLVNLPAGRVFIETYRAGYSRLFMVPLEVDRTDHVVTMPRPLQVSGRVVHADSGAPITGFNVMHEYQSDGTHFDSPDGTFKLSLSSTQAGERPALTVEAPGCLRETVRDIEAKFASEVDYDAVVFRLRPSGPFEGVVTDAATREPIEGAMVTVLDTSATGSSSFYWESFPESWRPKMARTDDQGRFRFEDMPTQRGTVALEKPGYGRVVVDNAYLAKPLTASLMKAATISGTIVDDLGRAVSGVRVTVGRPDHSVQYGSATTGTDGRFTFTDLSPGKYLLEEHRGSMTVRLHHAEVVTGQNYEVDWNQVGESELAGCVTLRGKPVEGVAIHVYPADESMYAAIAKTGSDGAYSLSVPEAGKYRLTARKGDVRDRSHTYVRRETSLKPGKNRFDIVLPGATLSGTAIDKATGKPIADAVLRAYVKRTQQEIYGHRPSWRSQHTQPSWHWGKETTADKNGAFTFDELPAGDWLIAVETNRESGSGVPGEPFHLDKDETRQAMVVEIPETGSAEIAVVDAKTQKPVPDAYVSARSDQGFVSYPKRDTCSPQGCSIPFLRTSEGALQFASLKPGRYTAFPHAKGYLQSSVSFDVKPGKVARQTIELESGPKIIFHLQESPDESLSGRPWVGYKVTRPGVDKPIFEDAQGPYWGSILFLDGDPPREASLPISPGRYRIEMVLRTEKRRYSLSSKQDLWSDTREIDVVPGEDLIIEIPREGK